MKELSDFELNIAITKLLGSYYAEDEGVVITDDGFGSFDFNRWEDLMPLVVEYCKNIMVNPDELTRNSGEHIFWGKHEYFHDFFVENPQRALAEMLLKVLKERNK